jgi:hypothetical protein
MCTVRLIMFCNFQGGVSSGQTGKASKSRAPHVVRQRPVNSRNMELNLEQ